MEKIQEYAQLILEQVKLEAVTSANKDKQILELQAKISVLEALLQESKAKPLTVWVSGTVQAQNVVKWSLHLSHPVETDTLVKVQHTDTQTGVVTPYTWTVPKGQNEVSGTYPYSNLKAATFEVLPGEGYSVGSTPDQPQAVTVMLSTPVVSAGIDWKPPITITKGGTYGGFYRSADSTIPAIQLRTSEPVYLENFGVQTAGFGIENHSDQTNLVAKNGTFEALPHTGNTYNDPRRAFSVNNVINLLIEGCTSDGMGFLTTQGNYAGSGSQSIKVLRNKVENINGQTKTGRSHANFVQLMNIKNGIPGVEIAYNEIVNAYGKSDVEDNINVYKSKGTALSPIRIYGNLIQGAYYLPGTDKSYSGGGIIADSPDATDVTSFMDVFENYLLGIGNYCLGIASGNNITFRNNYCIVAGIVDTGKTFAELNLHASGMWAKDYYGKGQTYGNVFKNNTVGVNYGTGRKDISEKAGATWVDNIHLADPITKATEQLYAAKWLTMMQSKGMR